MNYDGPTPITDAFMTEIDDSEIDLGKVETQLKTMEIELAELRQGAIVAQSQAVERMEQAERDCRSGDTYPQRYVDALNAEIARLGAWQLAALNTGVYFSLEDVSMPAKWEAAQAKAICGLLDSRKRLAIAVQATLLFYSLDWTAEKKTQWWNLTQTNETTTKALCDCCRAALAFCKEVA